MGSLETLVSLIACLWAITEIQAASREHANFRNTAGGIQEPNRCEVTVLPTEIFSIHPPISPSAIPAYPMQGYGGGFGAGEVKNDT